MNHDKASFQIANSAPTGPRKLTFQIKREGTVRLATYQQLLASGHKLRHAKKYDQAAKIFEQLCKVDDRGPRAHIMLAHCQAMCGKFAECSATLSSGLPKEKYGNAATELHDTFVTWKLNFLQDTVKGLDKVIVEHPELPTPCLLLGDFLLSSGSKKPYMYYLQLAIRRDRPDGGIAQIAKKLLAKSASPKELGNDQQQVKQSVPKEETKLN